MAASDSALDADAVARARALLTPPVRRERLWPAITAAAFFATSALAFATAMVLAPPLVTERAVQRAP